MTGNLLRVMTFNVRCATARDDGPNAWPARQQRLLGTIARIDPDLLGVQEAVDVQVDALREFLPDYECVGVGRDDGICRGEFAAMFFRSQRFGAMQEGHFWLCERPEVPGLRGWDAALARMTSWVILRDQADGAELLWMNTHWDHQGAKARIESAHLTRSKMAELAHGRSIILSGDFNCTESSAEYALLTAELIDSYRQVNPVRHADEGTYHAFTGRTRGERIDWILHSPALSTRRCWIERSNHDGFYPSDHFPVVADLQPAAGGSVG